MSIYYNPLNGLCKSRKGAIPKECEVSFNIYHYKQRGEEPFSAKICTMVIFQDGKAPVEYPMTATKDGWSVTLKFHQIGLFFYYFRFNQTFLGCGNLRNGILCQSNPPCWQITVFEEDFSTPDWFKGGIMYQIFPDRFYKSGETNIDKNKVLRTDWGGIPRYQPNEFGKVLNNDFFGGNLDGVKKKLPYLKQLGVTVIYFNPIFEAYSNHRYDTGDYMKIDRLLGTEQDFDDLIAEAKQQGIRIILDGVFNHTGDDSRYFNKYGKYTEELGAHQSPKSPYFDWYWFSNFPDQYESWWGIDTLPSVNETCESFQNFICGEDGVLKNWLRHGIGGYRLDVADELPDFFLKKVRRAVKEENPSAIIIGEVWEDASNKIAYSERRQYLQGYELDSVMNYPLKDAIISYVITGETHQLRNTIAMLIDNYPKQVLDCLMNILGTHDTPRILTVLGQKYCRNKDEMAVTTLSQEEKTAAKKKLKMAAVLQFTLPGVPSIYYGDENAMEGYQDPFCRRCFDWEHHDDDLFQFYQKLGKIREKELLEAFTDGVYQEVFADSSCLVFERRGKKQKAYIYVNNSANIYTIKLTGKFRDHITDIEFNDKILLQPYSYGILSKV